MHTTRTVGGLAAVCINRDTVIIGLAMLIIHIAVLGSTEHLHHFIIACKTDVFKPFDKFRPAFGGCESQWILVVLLKR